MFVLSVTFPTVMNASFNVFDCYATPVAGVMLTPTLRPSGSSLSKIQPGILGGDGPQPESVASDFQVHARLTRGGQADARPLVRADD